MVNDEVGNPFETLSVFNFFITSSGLPTFAANTINAPVD
jgi:hypothetical protein